MKRLLLALLLVVTAGRTQADATAAGSRGPGSSAAGTMTSIILPELEPGTCDPVMFEAKNPGYTGAGYINSPNDKAARTTWRIRGEVMGSHFALCSPRASHRMGDADRLLL